MRRVFCEPTRHLAAAKQYVAENGIAVLTGVLSRQEVHRMRLAVLREADAAREAGGRLAGDTSIDTDEHTVRLFDLVAKDAIFRELLEHPISMDLVSHVLGPKVRLSNFSAHITGPGSRPDGMRADQGYVTSPWPAWPLAVSIIWAIDQFTAENGAPRVMADSVRYGHGPEWGMPYPEAEPLVCPPGSVIVMDGRIWHQNGANTTENIQRIGLSAHYVRPYILPEVEWHDVVPPDLRETMTPGLREMLGFGTRATRHARTRYGRQIWLEDPAPEA